MASLTPRIVRQLVSSLQITACPRRYAVRQLFPGNPVRGFASSARRQDDISSSGSAEENLTVNFVNRNGEILTAKAKEGESLLEVVVRHHLSIDGFGACEGTLACSTCHLIFNQKEFDQLKDITDEEMDMLDLAFGLTDKSRLGCQICMTKAIDGLTVRVPRDVADARRETLEQQSKQ